MLHSQSPRIEWRYQNQGTNILATPRGWDVSFWFSLVDVFDMLEMYVGVLVTFARDVARFEREASGLAVNKNGPILDADVAILELLVQRCINADAFFYLPQVVARCRRLKVALNQRDFYHEIHYQLRALREEMDDELNTRKFFHMPASKALHYFAGQNLLGVGVAQRFPEVSGDIEEAGKCLGCGRSTAVVFHLMRVLEKGVQVFGNQFNLPDLEHKEWQQILNDVNGKLSKMQKTDPKRAPFAELVSLLTAVKFAWRNEVMHPKAFYTEEQANEVFNTTKSFMGKVVDACPPPQVTSSP